MTIRLILAIELLAGIGLLILAAPLSDRYNSWTARARSNSPRMKTPTAEMRKLNTSIMSWLFRALGVFLIVLAAANLVMTFSN